MSDKAKALESAIAQITKQLGKGTVMKLGDKEAIKIETVSTGCLSLDIATGIGGIPRGRITEIYGIEMAGKSTLAMHAIAEAQKNGGYAAYIDAEHAFDPNYAKNIGIDIDNLVISQPDYGEQALEVAEALIRSGAIDIIVIDSVAALVPRAELEGSMGDGHIGLQARLMSQAMRKLAGIVHKSNTAIIFINQIRERIGVMFGNPETTTGGRALKFYASLRLEMRKISSIKDDSGIIGARVKVKVVKNKLAPPFKEAEFDILFGKGICYISDIVDLGVKYSIIQKSGAWYAYGDLRLGQGKENVKAYLLEHKDIFSEIEQKIKETLGLQTKME